MPITLKQIAANRALASFTYDGETVHIEYMPAKLSQAATAKWASLRDRVESGLLDEAGTKHEFDAMLVDLLAGWDVLEEEGGKPIPIDLVHMAEIPIEFETEILLAVMASYQKKIAMQQQQAEQTAQVTTSPPRSAATRSPARKSTSKR